MIEIEKLKNCFISVKLKDGSVIEGLVLEKPKIFESDTILLKLSNGYNIGISLKRIKRISVIRKKELKEEKKEKYKWEKNLPYVYLIGTGGTIASKVDYETGGVKAQYSPEDLVKKFPYILDLVNIKVRIPLSIYSEEFNINHYKKLILELEKLLEESLKNRELAGIIVMHGTDTMHYTSSLLSFCIQGNKVPIILTGAQRSSDRPSSDAYFNLLSSILIAKETNCSEIGICMHGTCNDDYAFFHRGTRVRKMHSTRRDAFISIGINPIYKIYFKERKIEQMEKLIREKNSEGDLKVYKKLSDKVSLIYYYPNFEYDLLEFLVDKGYKGIVIMGTGMGHIGVTTNKAKKTLERLKEENIVCVMTTQTIFGKVDPKVYSTGRILEKKYGFLYLEDILPEVAYTKLMWAIGNYESVDKVKEIMRKNISGEILKRRIY